MTVFSLVSHSINGVSFLFLAILLIISWRGSLLGGMLLIAVIVQVLYSSLQALAFYWPDMPAVFITFLEYSRIICWTTFVFMVLRRGNVERFSTNTYLYIYVVLVVAAVLLFLGGFSSGIISQQLYYQLTYTVILLFATLGVVLTEQLYRNIKQERRWAFKFLCFGLGLLFIYDLYMYANAALLNELDRALYDARGIATAFVVPLLAISASRNSDWSFDIFISRQIIFYSTGLIAIGIYITLMAIGGYYVKIYGGVWGDEARIIFLVGAGVVLLAIIFSEKTRTQVKLFLNKHFYKNKYDYREEWMRLAQKISEYDSAQYFRENILQTVATMMHSRGGMLYLERDGEYLCVTNWNAPSLVNPVMRSAPLPAYLNRYETVVCLDDYNLEPEKFQGLEIPPEIAELESAWLIIPLKHYYHLIGFILLMEPIVQTRITWEDRDLLKAVGRQVSSYLALMQTTESLMESEKFGAFNRLSAYVVHDMKNTVSQLELIVKNAEKFIHNPEFVEDAFATVANVVNRMRRMLNQLQKVQFNQSEAKRVDVAKSLDEVLRHCVGRLPEPELHLECSNAYIYVEPDRFQNIIEHLIRNAQEATDEQGRVAIHLSLNDEYVIIKIEDNGCGMNQRYINEELFRPFSTTKGNAGMGIGVFEAKEFIKYYNGKIDVQSEVNVGTTFVVSIPRYRGADALEH